MSAARVRGAVRRGCAGSGARRRRRRPRAIPCRSGPVPEGAVRVRAVRRRPAAPAQAAFGQQRRLRPQPGHVQRQPRQRVEVVGPLQVSAVRHQLQVQSGRLEGLLDPALLVERGDAFGVRIAAAVAFQQFGGVPGVPEVADGSPVVGRGRGGAETQRQSLRGLDPLGKDDVEDAGAVADEGDAAADGESAGDAGAARQVPAQQVGDQMPEVLGEGRRSRRAVHAFDGDQVEEDVDTGGGAGPSPVAGQAAFGGLLDHPPGDGVAADPLPADQFLTGRCGPHVSPFRRIPERHDRPESNRRPPGCRPDATTSALRPCRRNLISCARAYAWPAPGPPSARRPRRSARRRGRRAKR